MTKIRIKTPSLRRELTIESTDTTGRSWRVSMPGFRSQDFAAQGLHDAIDKGLALKDSLQVSQEELDRRAAASLRMKLNPIHLARSAGVTTAPSQVVLAEKSGRGSTQKQDDYDRHVANGVDPSKVA